MNTKILTLYLQGDKRQTRGGQGPKAKQNKLKKKIDLNNQSFKLSRRKYMYAHYVFINFIINL